MDVVESERSRQARSVARPGRAWLTLTLAGAATFWLANYVISLTPVAADYRSALGIRYVPMLVEAGAGGVLIAGILALVLRRFPERVPGAGLVRKALVLAGCAVALLTVAVEIPAKVSAGLTEPGRWLAVATVFNAVRISAAGFVLGWLARAGSGGEHSRRAGSGKGQP